MEDKTITEGESSDLQVAEKLAHALTHYDGAQLWETIDAAVAQGYARSVLVALSELAGQSKLIDLTDKRKDTCAFCGADVAGLAVTTTYAGVTVELCGACSAERASLESVLPGASPSVDARG